MLRADAWQLSNWRGWHRWAEAWNDEENPINCISSSSSHTTCGELRYFYLREKEKLSVHSESVKEEERHVGTSRSGRDKKKFSPHQPQTSAPQFPHVWLTQTSRPARFICFSQDETRSLVQSSAPPLWHCVPDDVILVSRALQTGCWWYKQSAGEGQDAFKAIWVCSLLCWKPPEPVKCHDATHQEGTCMCAQFDAQLQRSPPCLYGINQSFKKIDSTAQSTFYTTSQQSQVPAHMHTLVAATACHLLNWSSNRSHLHLHHLSHHCPKAFEEATMAEGEMSAYQSKTSPLDATGPHPARMSRNVCIHTEGQSNWMSACVSTGVKIMNKVWIWISNQSVVSLVFLWHRTINHRFGRDCVMCWKGRESRLDMLCLLRSALGCLPALGGQLWTLLWVVKLTVPDVSWGKRVPVHGRVCLSGLYDARADMEISLGRKQWSTNEPRC